jgi:hypothetical protein
LHINLGEVEDKRFELSEPSGRVFKAPGTSLRLIKNVLDKVAPGTSLRLIKNVLDKVKRDLGNSPLSYKRNPALWHKNWCELQPVMSQNNWRIT